MRLSYPATSLTQTLAAIQRAGTIVLIIMLTTLIVPASADFIFPDFSDPTGLTLIGSAEVVEQRLRLNPESSYRAGAAWFTTKQAVAGGFETTFQFQISVDGADGFAFVVQNDFPAISNAGDNFYAIPNSLAVEFDTFKNIPENYPSPIDDPSDNHISVQTRGLLPNSSDPEFSRGTTTAIPYMSDGNVHTVKITYTPGALRIFMDDLDAPTLVAPVDLADLLDLDGERAWVGLIGSTGGFWEAHDILSWSVTETEPVPEDPEEPDPTEDAPES